MIFNYTREQYNALDGLAYRVADNSYMVERYRDGAAVELAENDFTIRSLFHDLDRLAVPMWVQNAALAFGRDWRRYKSSSLAAWLESRNIYPV